MTINDDALPLLPLSLAFGQHPREERGGMRMEWAPVLSYAAYGYGCATVSESPNEPDSHFFLLPLLPIPAASFCPQRQKEGERRRE